MNVLSRLCIAGAVFCRLSVLGMASSWSAELTKVETKPILDIGRTFVAPVTGELEHQAMDLLVPAGAVTLKLSRRFANVAAGTDGLLGKHWSINWEVRMVANASEAVRIDGATQQKFTLDASTNRYRSPFGGEVVLAQGFFVHHAADGTRELFDARGRLAVHDHRNGNQIRVSYDDAGRLSQVDGPFKTSIKFTVDGRGNLTRATGSNGSSVVYQCQDVSDSSIMQVGEVRYKYDSTGRLAQISQPPDESQKITYDAKNRVIMRSWGSGIDEKYAYEDSVGLQTKIDLQGQISTTRWDHAERRIVIGSGESSQSEVYFDEFGRPNKTASGNGDVLESIYDDRGRTVLLKNQSSLETGFQYRGTNPSPSTITVPGGERIDFTYDANQNLLEILRGEVVAQTVTYRSDGLVATFKDEASGERQFEYDSAGNVASVTMPEANGRRISFDASGQPIRITQADRTIAAIEYDSQDRLTRRTVLGNEIESYAYDQQGKVVSATQNGGKWTFQYDNQQRLTSVLGPLHYIKKLRYEDGVSSVEVEDGLGRKSRYIYNEKNLLRELVDASGRTNRFEYDDMGRTVSQTDASGRKLAIDRDRDGNLKAIQAGETKLLEVEYQGSRPIRKKGPSKAAVEFEYDSNGRRSRLRYGNGEQFQYRYDSRGRVAEVIDGLNRSWKTQYKPSGELASSTTPWGSEYRFEYDASNQLIGIIDPNGHQRRIQYDVLGRRISEVDPLRRESKVAYDRFGNVEEVIQPDGASTRMRYDELGRLSDIRYADNASARFQYDAVGNLVREELGEQVSTYKYDNFDRLIETVNLPSKQTVRCRYDELGRRSSIEVVGVGLWNYEYNEADRLLALRDSKDRAVRFKYDETGRISEQVLPNGLKSLKSYDARGRLLTWTVADKEQREKISRAYRYDLAGNLIEELRDSRNEINYAYDSEDRLIGYGLNDERKEYKYDSVGNLHVEGMECTFDAADQLVQAGSYRFQYNASGSLVRRERDKREMEHDYGGDGRLSRVRMDGRVLAEFGYDAQGRRAWKKAGDRTTHYVYDGDRLLLERDSDGSTRFWMYGPELDRPLVCLQGNQAFYPVCDEVGSVVAMSNEEAQIIGRWDYEPYGKRKTLPADKQTVVPTTFGFAGGLFDSETGFSLFGARYYDSNLRRFLTLDPASGRIANPPSLHPYQYAYNNPLRYRDPSGATAEEIADAVSASMGNAGRSFGYGVGRLASGIGTLPIRFGYWATGNSRGTQRLNQWNDTFSQRVTGGIFGNATSMVTSMATEPLRFGAGAGTAWSDVEQGHYATAAFNTVLDVTRGIPLIRSAMTVGRGSIHTLRVLNAPATLQGGQVDPQMAQAFINEAASPGFQRMANIYARVHGRTIDWSDFMNRVRNASYQQMGRADIVRTGGGIAGAAPGGSRWLLGAYDGFQRIPVIGPAVQRQVLRHELLHGVQDVLWDVFAREHTMNFIQRQIWEVVPSLFGDPTIKVVGGTGLLLGSMYGTHVAMNYGPGAFDALTAIGQQAGNQSWITSLIDRSRGASAVAGGTRNATGNSSISSSSSSATIVVPNVIGMKVAAAVDVVKKAELVAQLALGTAASDPVQSETIYVQEPVAGTKVAKGASIKILMHAKSRSSSEPTGDAASTNSMAKKVPSVLGLSKSDAEQKLVAAGLKPEGEEKKDPNNLAAAQGKVFAQNPVADSLVASGSTVRFSFAPVSTSIAGSGAGGVPAADESIKPIVGTFNAIMKGHAHKEWDGGSELKAKPLEDRVSYARPVLITIEPSGAITGTCTHQFPDEDMVYDRTDYQVFHYRFRFELQGFIDWKTGKTELSILNGRNESRKERTIQDSNQYLCIAAFEYEASLQGWLLTGSKRNELLPWRKGLEKYQAVWFGGITNYPPPLEWMNTPSKFKILKSTEFYRTGTNFSQGTPGSDYGNTAREQADADQGTVLWYLAIVGPAEPEKIPDGKFVAFAIQPQKAKMRIGETKAFRAVAMTGNDDGTDVTRFSRWTNGPDFTALQPGTFTVEAKYRTKNGTEMEDAATITVTP